MRALRFARERVDAKRACLAAASASAPPARKARRCCTATPSGTAAARQRSSPEASTATNTPRWRNTKPDGGREKKACPAARTPAASTTAAPHAAAQDTESAPTAAAGSSTDKRKRQKQPIAAANKAGEQSGDTHNESTGATARRLRLHSTLHAAVCATGGGSTRPEAAAAGSGTGRDAQQAGDSGDCGGSAVAPRKEPDKAHCWASGHGGPAVGAVRGAADEGAGVHDRAHKAADQAGAQARRARPPPHTLLAAPQRAWPQEQACTGTW